MALAAGFRIGAYEILEPIGAGGMGEVYRARDTKLKRDVAIKVLPEAFANNEQRMKRFAREAEVLASLNHPNIAGGVWIHTVERGTSTRLTFDGAGNIFPVWSPDGERVLFRSEVGGTGVFWKSADGTGSAERVADGDVYPFSISPDGRRLVVTRRQPETTWDIAEVALDGSSSPEFIVVGPRNQWDPQISPSGRWLAYFSRESGRAEVYIRPFPDVDARRWQVSPDGGTYPLWSPDEKEVFYRNGDQILAVRIAAGSGRCSVPQRSCSKEVIFPHQ